MRRGRIASVVLVAALGVAACSGRTADPTATTGSTIAGPTRAPTTTESPPTSTRPTSNATSTEPPAATIPPASAPTSTFVPPGVDVRAAGTYADAELAIHLTFRSEIADTSTHDLETFSMSVLNDPRGWERSGFTFVVDPESNLVVVLAEPDVVDALCLPLETKGAASCQNGEIVALNAVRWRSATEDWDGSIDDYRIYLVTHEVGHLIGLRHPLDRCPDGNPASAVMEPQTAGLTCPGNGWPLEWEIEWARSRPAEVAPLPEWDGPRPSWP